MKPLIVRLKINPYPIYIDNNGLKKTFSTIKNFLKENRLFVVTNPTLKRLYGKDIAKAARAVRLEWLVIPDGEEYKTLKTCTRLYSGLLKRSATRSSHLLALGGGVVGDITGFVAATFMRGVGYFQMPTTLLAQVDAGVGGKTGVDLSEGKNLVGAFHQPRAVFIHTRFLKTLPARELRSGMAEVIKYGIIWDASLFAYIQTQNKKILSLQIKPINTVIRRCCSIKAEIVRRDEREKGLRAILNFGHTLAHALEALTRYKKYRHGEAVALGMLFATKLSFALGFSAKNHAPILKKVLQLYKLPTTSPKFSRKAYLHILSRDKKRSQGNINFILLKKIGRIGVVPIDPRQLQHYL